MQTTATAFRPFIYGLVDPAEPGHVRYVGMASANASRPYEHARINLQPSTQQTYFSNWLRKLLREGRTYSVLMLEELSEGTPRRFVGFVERCYIDSLRKIGHRLTNTAAGGWGGSTGPCSAERRLKISYALKNKPFSKTHRTHLREAWRTRVVAPETIIRLRSIAASHIGKPGHPWGLERRAKIIALMKGRVASEETRLRMSAAHKGKLRSEEVRAHMKALRKPHSAATRAKMSAAGFGRIQTTETRMKLRSANLGKKASIGTRMKMSASHRESWRKRREEQGVANG
jgi:hypothetical protein